MHDNQIQLLTNVTMLAESLQTHPDTDRQDIHNIMHRYRH